MADIQARNWMNEERQMARMSEWYQEQSDEIETATAPLNTGLLSFTLTVAAAVVVLSLLITPFVSSNVNSYVSSATGLNTDRIVTGSIRNNPGVERYTVRRSILQKSPDAVCIIRNGSTRLEC
jgi:hypothetical protein